MAAKAPASAQIGVAVLGSLVALVLIAAATASDVSAERCDGGDGSCQAAEDDTSLLSLRRSGIQLSRESLARAGGSAGEEGPDDSALEGEVREAVGEAVPKARGFDWKKFVVQCPGSTTRCSPLRCCPGVKATNGRSFPCPTSKRIRKDRCDGGDRDLVSALLGAMTKEEKYRFLRGTGWVNGTWEWKNGYYIGDAGLNQRFGIPSQNMEDNGQGFRTVDKRIIDEVTSWPVTLAVASSWSEADTRRWAVALGKEFKIKGANVILGPGVNVHRVARGGRNAEYISGESAYFGSRMVVPWVQGVQSESVLAVVKHFVVNNQEDHRDTVDVLVDEKTLWEVYYPPFEAAVKAGVASAMCGYNLVNGVHACGNSRALVTDLKETMGFGGWVQSDWWALHKFAALEGVDQEMPGDSTPSAQAWYTDANLNTLSDSKVDDMVGRQLTMMRKHGLFEPKNRLCEPPHCDYELYEANATSDKHQALCRELATKAVMLLKNDDDVLPVRPSTVKRLALLGSACNAAQDVQAQLDTWDLGSYYNIGGSGRVIAWDPVSVHAGIAKACDDHGIELVTSFTDDASKAAQAARGADVAIICGGTSSTEGHDRANLAVDQQAFLVDIAKKLKGQMPVVSVTMTPGAILMPWLENVAGVVNAFLNGKYTGTAFADVIFGHVNPSAKTVVTFPVSEDQVIAPCQDTACSYDEGTNVGYLRLEGKRVNFPFGHGLSYTGFQYMEVKVALGNSVAPCHKSRHACKGAVICVHAKVLNVGDRAGSEIAQLYLDFPEEADQPKNQLRGFTRTVELGPGTVENVAFPLYERDLQVYLAGKDVPGKWATPNGKFSIRVGASSRDTRLSAGFAACPGGSVSLSLSGCLP